MLQAKSGNKVKVHYTVSSKEGKMFYSSKQVGPAEFVIGGKRLVPDFENAVIGMTAGETKKVYFPPGEAFGNYNEKQVTTIDRSRLPSDIDPQVGMMLNTKTNDGKVSNVTITNITDETITLDANHPLAGKGIIFELELVAIE